MVTCDQSHPTPHVCGIQVQLPETKVEASTSTAEYARNSNSIGIVLLKLDEIGAGDARRDTGSPTRSIKIGTTINREDKDIWTTSARANSDADI